MTTTTPELVSPEPRIGTRVYGLPFARVWRAAREVLRGLPDVQVTGEDPHAGLILAEAHSRILNLVADLEVRISLDEVGMTRVEMRSAARSGRFDFGGGARRVARTLAALDAELGTGAPRA